MRKKECYLVWWGVLQFKQAKETRDDIEINLQIMAKMMISCIKSIRIARKIYNYKDNGIAC